MKEERHWDEDPVDVNVGNLDKQMEGQYFPGDHKNEQYFTL